MIIIIIFISKILVSFADKIFQTISLKALKSYIIICYNTLLIQHNYIEANCFYRNFS